MPSTQVRLGRRVRRGHQSSRKLRSRSYDRFVTVVDVVVCRDHRGRPDGTRLVCRCFVLMWCVRAISTSATTRSKRVFGDDVFAVHDCIVRLSGWARSSWSTGSAVVEPWVALLRCPGSMRIGVRLGNTKLLGETIAVPRTTFMTHPDKHQGRIDASAMGAVQKSSRFDSTLVRRRDIGTMCLCSPVKETLIGC